MMSKKSKSRKHRKSSKAMSSKKKGKGKSTRSRPKTVAEEALEVGRGLKDYYMKYILPIEKAYNFDKFAQPYLTEADFVARPMVLLCGQYSVGKTTFIKYLLERDFPGMRIGPEPTTDKFCAIMYGMSERIVPGNAAAVQNDKPFKNLEKFGMAFLNRFEVAEVPAPILEHITFIDSPGVLSGEKQRVNRGYNFGKVIKYWAGRVDRIVLLFDAHKLDISDEFQECILALKGNFDKIRCLLNKADKVNTQQLMRVYGALLWSLGKVVLTPEVLRVYIGSFIDQPYQNEELAYLFDKESTDLISDLKELPRSSSIRKVNEFVKRGRQAKVHALICNHLYSQFGYFYKDATQLELLKDMAKHFQSVAKKYNIPKGDFPNPNKFADIMKEFKIYEFTAVDEKSIHVIDKVLSSGVPKLLEKLGSSSSRNYGSDEKMDNPFADNPFNTISGPDVKMGRDAWVINSTMKATYDQKFYSMDTSGGKALGSSIMPVMMASGLSNTVLKSIWDLSDIDKDGKMDADEFALCMYLIESVKKGGTIPDSLPLSHVPPSKR